MASEMKYILFLVALLLPALVQAQTCVQADINHPETVTLTWQDNSTDESGFMVERKQDAGAFAVIAAALAPDTKTYIDTSVKRAAVPVTYTYRVKAFRNEADKTVTPSASSNESCITFAAVIPPPPILQAPAGLTLSGISQTQIQASWDDTANETGYRLVLVGKSPPIEYVNYPAKDETNFTQGGLPRNKTFCGTLYALADGNIASPASGKSCATTKK